MALLSEIHRNYQGHFKKNLTKVHHADCPLALSKELWQHQVPVFMSLSSGFDHCVVPEECNHWYNLILGEREPA